MTEPIRIVVADDHPLFREGVALTLNQASDVTVVGQASSGKDALKLTVELLPDILLLDIAMAEQDGLDTAEQVAIACPSVRIIMLTVSEDQADLMRALKVGAKGYILKGVSASELVEAVRGVAAGEVRISPVLASNILFEMTYDPKPDPIDNLSDRERQILHLVGEGLTNREIGDQLNLAEKTIKHYMTNVLQKLHVRSRVEAALLAKEHALKQSA